MKGLFVMKNLLCLSLFFIFLMVATIGCSWIRPYHATPVAALTEFPGFLTSENISTFQLLQKQEMAGGVILLYAYESNNPQQSGTCIGTTFVTQKDDEGWRAQSSGNLGCRPNFLDTPEFVAGYTVGGNITDLAVAYGLASKGQAGRVYWSDDLVTQTAIQDGVFITSRPKIVHVLKMELLDVNGAVLETNITS